MLYEFNLCVVSIYIDSQAPVMTGKTRVVAQEAYDHRLDQQQAEIKRLKEMLEQLSAQKQMGEAAWAAHMQAATEELTRQQRNAEFLNEQNAQQKQYINKLEEREDVKGKRRARTTEEPENQFEDDRLADDEDDEDEAPSFCARDAGTDDEGMGIPQNKDVRL